MKTKVIVHRDVAAAFKDEPQSVKNQFIYLLETFETRFPRFSEWYHGDKRSGAFADGTPTYSRFIDKMYCSYVKTINDDGVPVYFVYLITYRTIKHAMPKSMLPPDHDLGGVYCRLGDIPPGSLFVTRDGVMAVKSKYYSGNDAASQCQCVLLTSGKYANFKDKNDEQVKLLSPRSFL